MYIYMYVYIYTIYIYIYILYVEHVRCNSDVAPRLTSGGYEEKLMLYYSNQHIVHRGWQHFDASWRYS